MKTFLKYFLCLIFLSGVHPDKRGRVGWANVCAQNLVPNSSFEQYSTCPNAYFQIAFAFPWFQPNTNNSMATIYFNQCSTNANISVPFNINGYQQAHTGNAYAGIGLLYFLGVIDGGRYYLEVQLDSTLLKDKKYLVSFYASLSNDSKYATDAIGAYFSSDSVTYSSTYFPALPLIPQVTNHVGNIISDTVNWVLISGQYIASGGEKFITIGNFYPDNASGIDTVNLMGADGASYYIDDVSVVPDTTTEVSELQKESMKFKVYPNPTESEIIVEYYGNIKQIMTLNLYNLLGVQIGTHTFDKGSNTMKISLSNYEAGIYFYKIASEDKTITENKLIIIKR